MAQTFQLLDTNLVALTDTNLYNILLAFPADTNTGPSLQIARRATNAVVVKANRFDYSAETTRNFALLVCDKPETPVWKNIDLLASSDTQDGWLIQGSVQPYKVTNPMFMLVSNINLDYSAFFRATPYGGPEILLSAAQNYSTVSNTITLTANISDLTGTRVTNHQFAVKVNGLPARWAHTSTNGITLDTRYAPAGIQEVEVTMGSVPVVFDPQDPPISTTLWDANSQQLEWDATATLPLDFENPAFLVNASDMCSPDMGTNYITFGINQAGQISATISEPSSGRLLATYSGYVPYAATLSLEWNFTERDGVTPYTNDTYQVHFAATGAAALDTTNTIDRQGVRVGHGTILTYTEENPLTDSTGTATWCNSEADTWIAQTLQFLYNDLYDQWGLTQYYDWQVGLGRNITTFYIDTPYSQNGWRQFMQEKLGSSLYSDATIGPMHGGPTSFGAVGAGNTASFRDVGTWASAAGRNWRMRKVALWACFTASGGTTFIDAFGIRPKPLQDSTYMRKNAGIFWLKDLPDYPGRGWSMAKAAASFDEAWVCGPNAYPGGCDPTWGIGRTFNNLLAQYPALRNSGPVLAGYYWLPYSDLYDDELMGNVLTHVHQ